VGRAWGSLIGRRCLRCFALVAHGQTAPRSIPPDASWGWVLSARSATPGRWRHPDRLADTAGMRIQRIPAGFIVPAQPVLASNPPSGAGWVHEIKHDGYRMIVRWDGAAVRIYSRNGNDWTARLAGIAATAGQIEARSFTVDGEAVVLGPDGLSRFEELSGREAADDGEDMRDRPFLDRKAALARLLRDTEAGILFNEHIAEDGAVVFAHACRLGAEGIVSKKVDGTYRSGPCRARAWHRMASAVAPPSTVETRTIWERQPAMPLAKIVTSGSPQACETQTTHHASQWF
jgi:hypothetical protein